MSRRSEAPATIKFLEDTGGADWETIADHFGITRLGAAARITAARAYMVARGSDKTIPRPTVGTGWLYQVTDRMYAHSTETSVGRSSVDDLRLVTAVARRLANDASIAYDALQPNTRRSRAGTAVLAFMGAMSNAATVCESERRVLETALRQLP
jgi:hypothetical protein